MVDCMGITKYKDFLFIILLLIFFVVASVYCGHIYGNLYMDCGREAILPELILKGKVLFKDIFGMYNPFSYQINAGLYKIFGVSLNTLYGAAYFNAFLFIVGIYLICRRFISEYYSFSITVLLAGLYVFGCKGVVCYLFPYSYAMIYAVTMYTYSVLVFLYYMEKENIYFLYLSGLFLGLSFANKPEFGLCIIPMLIVMALNKEKFKTFVITLIMTILPIICSYLGLFLQGFNYQDLVNYLDFTVNFFNTEEQFTYTNKHVMAHFDDVSLITMFYDFTASFIIAGITCFYISLFTKNTYTRLFAILFCPIFISSMFNVLFKFNNLYYFSWATIVLLVLLYIHSGKKETSLTDKMLVFLILTALLSMVRINFIPLSKYAMGIYTLLPIIVIWIYFVKAEFKLFKNINYKQYLALTFIVVGLLNICVLKEYTKEFISVNTSRGTISQPKAEADMFVYLENWVNYNTKKNDSVLMMPEGIMLNFVTGRPTKDMYYHLIPNHISAMGENDIVTGLDNDKPEYIIINSAQYTMYGKTEMCRDFGQKICKFVKNNYKKVKEFSTIGYAMPYPFKAKIYKLK